MSLASVATVNQAQVLAAKMASGDPELAGHAFASSGLHTISNNGVTMEGPGGHRIGDNFLDMLAGGIGAFDHRDGIDYGGGPLAVAHHFSDVEKFEQAIPFLYLYRRELPHSGGHGRFRGGATLAAAWVGHKDDTVLVSSSGFVKSVTMGVGLCGGYPATGGYHWHATDTAIREWFASGRTPGGPAELRELAPHGGFAPVRPDNRLRPSDVFELLPNPGAGWGDPLEREIRHVTADLAAGRLRPSEAAAVYGVVLDDAGAIDPAATAERRDALREARLRDARPPRRPGDGTTAVVDGAQRAIEGVALVPAPDGGAPRFACAACGCDLGDAHESYRLGCGELDLALPTISELFPPPEDETGQVFVLRGAACPGCGRLLDAHVCRPADVPYRDVALPVPSGGPA
jgi:N-methylhydantoinase B